MVATREMANARRTLATDVARAFLPLEESADQTASLALRCAATLLDVRRSAGLGVTDGEHVLKLIHEGCSKAFEAQQIFRRAHADLLPLAEHLKISAYAPECPGLVSEAAPGLRAVA